MLNLGLFSLGASIVMRIHAVRKRLESQMLRRDRCIFGRAFDLAWLFVAGGIRSAARDYEHERHSD